LTTLTHAAASGWKRHCAPLTATGLCVFLVALVHLLTAAELTAAEPLKVAGLPVT
jgi:hypothetical protein